MISQMMRKTVVSIGFAAYVAGAPIAQADDTEIFFNTATKDTTKPNILFVLDTSGSMKDTPSGGGGSKIDILKNVIPQILSELQNVNAGMARYTVPGGPILYPVTDIDAPASPIASSTVTASSDDAEESTAGAVNLTSTDLDLMEETDQAKWVGIRFTKLAVPQGAKIEKALLSLSAAETASSTLTLRIYAQDIDDAATFAATTNNISSRAKTAYVDWAVSSWGTVAQEYSTVDLSALIQTVVNRAGWCGGNNLALLIQRSGAGTAKRSAYSYDGSTSETPTLRVQYSGDVDEFTSGANRCIANTVTSSISVGTDDIEEASDNKIRVADSQINFKKDSNTGTDNKAVGLRFTKLAIPKDADVTSATLSFRTVSGDSASATMKLHGVAVDDFTGFSTGTGSLTSSSIWPGSARTSASASVSFSSWSSTSTWYNQTGDFSPVIEEIVSQADWKPGNSLGLMLYYQSGSNKNAYSYEGNSGRSARLTINYKAPFQKGAFTVRDELKLATSQLKADGYTPISDTLLEAGLYYRGDSVLYGKSRQGKSSNLVSHPDSYTGGTAKVIAGCDPVLDPFNAACAGEVIEGSPKYVSPITDSCQSNHIVFMTDGLPTWNAASTASTFKTMSGGSTCVAGTGYAAETAWGKNGSDCVYKIADFLHTKDQSGLPADQNVTTHFIGFDLDSPFLETAAANGGGSYKTASDADSLVDAFQEIINNILQTNGTFVSAGVTVNQNNRLTHLDQLYFSVFGPTLKPRWPGNLKRYRLTAGSNIVDVNGIAAINPTSDQFSDDAKSWWSPDVDGNNPSLGGAAAQLSNNRNVYTNLGSGKNEVLLTAGNAIADSNSAITASMVNAGSAAERTALLNWARGVDVDDIDGDGSTTDANNIFGDPLHSRPALLRFKPASGDSYLRVFVGTNAGYMHSLDPADGSEQWAYMPKELLEHLKTLRDNSEGLKKPYGLDGAINVYHLDLNRDGMVNVGTAEKAYLIFGMRRGGDKYYALDVSNPAAPVLKFVIEPAAGKFENLGQTWSMPLYGKIKTSTGDKEARVLIFGGGYDVTQDDNGAPLDDSRGNAVYIAALEDVGGTSIKAGDQIWSSDSLALTSMTNSIPADVAAVDLNADGYIDHVYAVDMRAQVFRFDLKTDGSITGDRFAKLQLDGAGKEGNRRFYGGIDLALIGTGADGYVAVAVGSGYREHPLDTEIDDHFYVLKDTGVFSNTVTELIELDDLLDITDLVGDSNDDGISDAIEEMTEQGSLGWYYNFSSAGEKVLSAPVIFDNSVLFTTYLPPSGEDGSVDCSSGTGSSRFYLMSLIDGNPVKDKDGDGLAEADDRVTSLSGATPGFTSPLILFPQCAPGEDCDPECLAGVKGCGDLEGGEPVTRIKWRQN